MPSFWLGVLIILGLLVTTKALFGSPWMPPIKYVPIWVDPLYNLSMTIFPALATGYRYSAVATRMTRSALLEVLREDYVRTARAKGLVQQLIIRRHALGNALLPVVTIIGIEFAFLMGGLVVTEQVFNLNGLGKLFVASVDQSRLHDDAGAGHVGGDDLRRHQLCGGHHLRVARPADPVQMTAGIRGFA